MQFQPTIENAEDLVIEIGASEGKASEKHAQQKEKAIRNLHTAAFEPLVNLNKNDMAILLLQLIYSSGTKS